MNVKNVVALGLVAGALLGTPGAHAFQVTTCDGAKVKWPGNSANMKMTRNLCSVPSGSTQATSYFSAIDRWNQVGGSFDKLDPAFAWPPDQCFYTKGDDVNDFALVDVAQIDGNLGSALVWWDCSEIYEVDIRMANLNTQSFVNPDESFAVGLGSPTGRFAVLHEFGHGLGLSLLNHVNGFAVMRTSPPAPLAGGLGQEHARVMPDDAAGVRKLYPSGLNEFNLMASAQRLVGTAVVNNTATSTVTVCRGGAVNFNWTMVNAGTVAATVDNRFFLHTSSTGHNQTGVTLGTWFGATVNPNGSVFPNVTLNVPCGTTAGTYFLFHEVDANDDFGEWNESDNVVRQALKVQVNNCGC
jgi:hypothetical protein